MLGYLCQVMCSCYLDQRSAHTDIHFMWFQWCNMHSTMNALLHISIITPGPPEKWGQRLVYWPLKDLQKLFNSTARVQLSDCLLMWCISSRVPLNRQRGRSKVFLHRVVTQIKLLTVTWGSFWLLMFTASEALRGGVVVLFGGWCVEVGRRALSSYSWSPLQNAWSGMGGVSTVSLLAMSSSSSSVSSSRATQNKQNANSCNGGEFFTRQSVRVWAGTTVLVAVVKRNGSHPGPEGALTSIAPSKSSY